jgi:uncharacterized protein
MEIRAVSFQTEYRLIDRRAFLKAAGAGFIASLGPLRAHAIESADAVFATAYQRRGGAYGVAILSEGRSVLHCIDLPDRGHDVTFDPISRRSVVFARRPGTFAVVFDHTGRGTPVTITSASDRHFFGHGVFSRDGKFLYATENDFENAAGMIGIYDASAGFRRVGEFPTRGMDPHDLLLMPDGRTLAIANGGIETHPDFGRAKLNLSTMKPSLVFVNRVSGKLIEEHLLPPKLHQLSIRHMDIDPSGAVWFGCQYEGPATDRPLLVGKARPGADLELLDMPEEVLLGLRNYIGSVAANRKARTIAVSSPQGNSLAVIDAATSAVLSTGSRQEVCGIAPDQDGFMATTGTGEIADPEGDAVDIPDYVWDNHLLRIM